MRFALILSAIFASCCYECKIDDFSEIREQVTVWANALSKNLWDISVKYTRKMDVDDSFKETIFTPKNGTALYQETVAKLEKMLQSKEKAIKNIATSAEIFSFNRKTPIDSISLYSYFNTDKINNTKNQANYLDFDEVEKQYRCELNHFEFAQMNVKDQRMICPMTYYSRSPSYYNSLPLRYDRHFGKEVNVNYTAVRVSPTVFWRENDVLNEVRWTEPLVLSFKQNFKDDLTLTWQYFASQKGFLRVYPALKWSNDDYDKIFDFRQRNWYTDALTYPKDVVILLDKSGSMTGTRKAMSKYIVNNILDTLSSNDFVNIYLFDNGTKPLVECFGDNLVPANEQNLRMLREELQAYKTEYRADLGGALEKAFSMLYTHRRRNPNKCTQAIMLVTEGLDYNYKPEVFKKYNRPHAVRVFTFQVGSQDGDQETLKRIACENYGYYVNISDPGEAHEKVFRYLNVMSRPLNLYSSKNVSWSELYADLSDRRLSSWLWKKYEGRRQRENLVNNIPDIREKTRGFSHVNYPLKSIFSLLLMSIRFIRNYVMSSIFVDYPYEKYKVPRHYTFLITVSMPVLDLRPKQPELLGVSAVDVPIELLKSIIPHYKIGANGYAFLVSKNGHIIFHPDHRTMFKNMLKPNFDKVDMLEVEQMGDQTHPRVFDKSMTTLRSYIVNQLVKSDHMNVKVPLDNNRRVMLSRRYYYFGPLGQYNLVIVLPEKHKDFSVEHAGEDSLFRQALRNIVILDRNWTMHPNWHYCRTYDRKFQPESYEEELLIIADTVKNKLHSEKMEKFCDTKLVKMFFADLKATHWFDGNIMNLPEMRMKVKDIPLIRTFLATHSGLTRWQDVDGDVPLSDPEHFSKKHNKAIDEEWYRKSVELGSERDMFVYSIPLDSQDKSEEDIVVTATSALFLKAAYRKAPIAVMGYQFPHKSLVKMFHSIVNYLHKPGDISRCGRDLSCFLLDDNAYIMVNSEGFKPAQFFGDARPDILNMLVKDGVYTRVPFFDYQSVCLEDIKTEAAGFRPSSIFQHFAQIFFWGLTTIFQLVQLVLGNMQSKDMVFKIDDFDKFEIKKTIPKPCDTKRYLYTIEHPPIERYYNYRESKHWKYLVKPLYHSNLILVVINDLFPINKTAEVFSPEPTTIEYPEGLDCFVATKNNFTKRVDMRCYNYYEKEKNLKDKKYCGG